MDADYHESDEASMSEIANAAEQVMRKCVDPPGPTRGGVVGKLGMWTFSGFSSRLCEDPHINPFCAAR